MQPGRGLCCVCGKVIGNQVDQPGVALGATKGLQFIRPKTGVLMMENTRRSKEDFEFLSELVLSPSDLRSSSDRTIDTLRSLNRSEFEALETLAAQNHVVIRAFSRLSQYLKVCGNTDVAGWVPLAIEKENDRIRHALGFLDKICSTLEQNGCPVTVIKSLDHWPDLGSDLDLYTDTESSHLVEVMRTKLHAKVHDRSWGDRLANKWNFVVPGLTELVEVHVRRLGQTGEQTAVTKSLSRRARMTNVGDYSFRVPAPEERIIISTLQRMYRHFYIRLCDVIDNAALVDAEWIDFTYLHSLGSAAGIWEGIAWYLTIISRYVQAFRGHGIRLPALVTASAEFAVDHVYYQQSFLRVPILPHSLSLYAGELRTLVLRGELRNSLRLSLLPGLATVAALELKITGSDKGIW